MASPEILLISIGRALVEVAGYALFGQGALAVLAGKSRDDNVVYRLLQSVTAPAVKAVRLLMPRVVIDRHIPIITFFVLFWLWIGLALAKRYFCAMDGLSCMQ